MTEKDKKKIIESLKRLKAAGLINFEFTSVGGEEGIRVIENPYLTAKKTHGDDFVDALAQSMPILEQLKKMAEEEDT